MSEKYKIADEIVEEKLLAAIIPGKKRKHESGSQGPNPFEFMKNIPGMQNYIPPQYQQPSQPSADTDEKEQSDVKLAREQVREQMRQGLLEEQFVEIDVIDNSANQNTLDIGGESMNISLGSIFGGAMPEKTKSKRMKVKDARKILREQEAQNLLDQDEMISEALDNAEQNGIVFIDEMDKIASESGYGKGANVSREGVQRDILPIVEGSVVNTKYGPVRTDHMLFIGAGAFHVAKPTDLIPELQGRFPIRVELNSLNKEDFIKILTQPKNALIKQHEMLLGTEGVNVTFTADAIDEIAEIAFLTNEQTENIGARRLHTIMEKLVEDVSYELPFAEMTDIIVDKEYVTEKFIDRIRAEDIDRFIL